MTDFMMYWKHYWRDVNLFGPSVITPAWHTSNDRVFNQMEPGDNIWVIIQGGPDSPGEWKLLQKIRILKLEVDTDKDRFEVQEYGPYHAIGDVNQSQVFRTVDQPDFTPTLKQLTFRSGKPLTSTGTLIGRSFQSARPLSMADIRIIQSFVPKLKLEDG